MYKIKELKELLIVLNSDNMFQYPIGNKELNSRVHYLEEEGILNYDSYNRRWEIA